MGLEKIQGHRTEQSTHCAMLNRVQPMFNPFEAAGIIYGPMAKKSHKMAINGHEIWKMVSLKVEHIITQPNGPDVYIGFCRSQHFSDPPPLNT